MHTHIKHRLMENWQQVQRNCRAKLIVATAVTTIAATMTSPLAAQSEQNFLVEFIDDELSIQASNILVKDLLLEIQDKTGIPVNFVSDPKDTISLNITGQSVENAIAKISSNHMIIHGHTNGIKTINELIIISDDPELKSTGNDSANLPSGQPAPEIAAATEQPSAEQTDRKATDDAQPVSPEVSAQTDSN